MIHRTIVGEMPREEDADPSPHTGAEAIRRKGEAHVDWFLRTVRPLMIEQFIHGYKHGLDARCEVCEVKGIDEL